MLIAKDEARNLRWALPCLEWCDEVVVVDNGSTDGSGALARRLGAKVVDSDISNDFSSLRNVGVNSLDRVDWVLHLDCDMRVTSELRTEISTWMARPDLGMVDAFAYPVENYFLNRRIRFGDWGKPSPRPWLVRIGHAWMKRSLHERVDVDSARIEVLGAPVLHITDSAVRVRLEKSLRYSTMRAAELQENATSTSLLSGLVRASYAAGRSYFLRLGFLDGRPGGIIALQTFHAVWCVYAMAGDDSDFERTRESLEQKLHLRC